MYDTQISAQDPSLPQPATKTIGGITFEDPYSHLQADTEQALEWQWAQADAAREYARAFPGFADLAADLAAEPFESPAFAPPVCRAGRWFSARLAADLSGHEILVGSTIDSSDAVVCVRPDAVGGTMSDPAFVYRYAPSPDARYVVVTVLPGGRLDSRTYVVDVETGRADPLVLEVLVFLGFAEPSWLPGSSGFVVGDRAPDGRHRVRRVTVHASGHTVTDHYFRPDEVAFDHPVLTQHVSPGGKWSVGVSAPHERTALRLGDLRTGDWRPFLPEGFDGECHGDWLDDDTYVAIVTHDTSFGRVVAIPVATSFDESTWGSVLPTGDGVLRTLLVRNGRIVLADTRDVSFRLRVLDMNGDLLWTAPLPSHGHSSLTFPPRLSQPSDMLVFSHGTFVRRQSVYALDVARLELRAVGEPSKPLDGIDVSQHFAVGEDGTRVPYYLVHRADLDLSQAQPTLIRAYGGFNLAFAPFFLNELIPFVRAGGVYVHANLRGGSEYGRDWYEAGRLLHKQDTFNDLFAVAEDLIARGIATPERLAVQGASNGGLLAGVACVQRPELFRAAVPQAPLLDMMEPVRPAAGEDAERVRSVFREDYGDPNDPDHAEVLYEYSPYHNIIDGQDYPAVFQIFGEDDLGCPPYHGRKFTARLQRATASGRPVLLRVWRAAGHGGSHDPDTNNLLNAEWLAFVMRELGMTYDRKG